MIKKQNRSSVLFPLYLKENISNKIYFLNYWKMKNDLSNTQFQITLRDYNGNLIHKLSKKVDEIATASLIDIEDEFKNFLTSEIGEGFKASIEIELFFEKPPKYNFPALILNYSDKNNSTFVHSCLRTFNDNELPVTESYEKNQTGFNIFHEKDLVNYMIFITGKQKIYDFKIIVENGNEKREIKQIINNEKTGKLIEIKFDDVLSSFNDNTGIFKVSINHNIRDVFSRFYVGNYKFDEIPTLTHTFFDEHKISNLTSIKSTENWDCVFSFPFFNSKEFNNVLASYNSNIKWNGIARFEFLNSKGKTILMKDLNVDDDFILFKTSFLNINDIFSQNEMKNFHFTTFKISFKGNVPFRNKFGLNYSRKNKMSRGSNICFAPIIYDESLNNKPISTTWSPVGGLNNIIFFHNNSNVFKNNLQIENNINISFFNHEGKMIKKDYILKGDEILIIDVSKDSELDYHFNKNVGWCFLKTDNNYSNSWYLQFGKDTIGGDHAF